MLKESIKKVRESAMRIIVNLHDGKIISGTGFFFKEGKLITCAHVAFGCDGLVSERDILSVSDDDKLVVEKFKQRVKNIKILKEDKTDLGEAELTSFDIKKDFVILSLNKFPKTLIASINKDAPIELGEKIAFCGFPKASDSKDPLTYPFMLNEGIVSGISENSVGGFPPYQHIQINAISLGGFSGSPLFLEETGEVIGLINGNAQANITAAVVLQGNTTVKNQDHAIPLGIAYATSLKNFSNIIN